ncbi:PLP-dependent aminotransferase family protein [Mucilaginibacter endophyticus]|uniref:aminotransferase-like domain-containing protein n=1 Tax=Mucilaginibacter endophyticus TaxID=2675003 RepID=UPI000E0DF554|nr:PLP-dependent aminotransferase family protein [Mucilaginibacter endophyticus]
MLPFNNLIVADRNSKITIAKQVSNQIVKLIRDGVVVPGALLPATRVLADLIGVNRKTINKAYEELLNEEWIESVPRQGFRVKTNLPLIKPRSFHPQNKFEKTDLEQPPLTEHEEIPKLQKRRIADNDLLINDGLPDYRLTPYQEMNREYRKHFINTALNRAAYFLDQGGHPSLKTATATFLNGTRGLNAGEDNIIITRGGQMAIYLAITLLVEKGETVVVTEPNYIFADETFKNAGAVINRIAVDEEGMIIEEFEKILQSKPVKMLYLAPHHHHPTTVTMSSERRLGLLQLMSKFDFWVLEDDYDYDYHHSNRPILPLATSCHNGKIIYVGSYSKLLGPSVRLGFMVSSPRLTQRALQLKRLFDLKGDVFGEYVIAQMIMSGALDRHIQHVNKVYASRCHLMSTQITTYLGDKVSFKIPQGGLALWVKFDHSCELKKLIKKAAENGLHLLGNVCHNKHSRHNNSIRLGFASLEEQEITQAICILSKLIT